MSQSIPSGWVLQGDGSYRKPSRRALEGRGGVLGVLDEASPPKVASEASLHDQIAAELKRRQWYFVHSRTDRATTQAKGVPDFIIARPDGVTLWLEIKLPKGKLTPEQAGTIHWLRRLGHRAEVIYSFEEFLSHANDKSSNPA